MRLTQSNNFLARVQGRHPALAREAALGEELVDPQVHVLRVVEQQVVTRPGQQQVLGAGDVLHQALERGA